jgi:serine protease Do
MNGRRNRPWWLVVAAAALVTASCGGSDSSSGDTTPTSPTTPSATEAPTLPPVSEPPATEVVEDEGISSVDDIRPAIVQIIAQGSFRDPAEGTQAGGWTGSGFVIDPDGIIVTNNHVVTGAGALKARMENGDEIAVQVLGVSECNDLAVVKLTEPGPYPYLEWYQGEIKPPLEIYLAGFPLGDPEYTITRGIVSKADAAGDTQWASVRHTIEHDASSQPGNSGGPLVTEDGLVVGVHYASANPGTGTQQFEAIAGDLAEPIVEQLRNGDVETIGVNGEAFVADDGVLQGVWVSGVEAGSPAASAGVLPGDVITQLNGVPLDGGTMAPYCDVLRSTAQDHPIAIEVIRFDTGEVWAGELNGTPMEVRYSFAEELADEVPDDSGSGGQAVQYEYETVVDDTGTIVVSVPTAWVERNTAPWDLGLAVGPAPTIWAAPDLQAFIDSYDSPGMLMIGMPSGASEFGTPSDALGLFTPDDASCVSDGRSPYEDGAFVGELEAWFCGSGSAWVVVAANPIGQPDAMIVVGVVAVTDADLEALDEVLYTFNFG